jgi:hypothetical protein
MLSLEILHDNARPTNHSTESEHPELFYGERFWEQYVGKNFVTDPVIAIIELVANCWDAGAKKVEITWPANGNQSLRIDDDGESMSKYHLVQYSDKSF